MNPSIFYVLILVVFAVIVVLIINPSGSSSKIAEKRLKTFTQLDEEALIGLGGPRGKRSGKNKSGKDALAKKAKTDLDRITTQIQIVLLVGVLVVSGVVILASSKGKLPRHFQNFLPLGIVLVLIPRAVRNVKVMKMRSKFAEQFPGALRMMVNALKAGQDIRSSFEMVTLDMPDPIKAEFNMILQELNVGINMETTLKNFEERVKTSDVKVFVTGILMNSKLGGNLTEILQKLESAIRERARTRREIGSLTAQSRFSAIVFCLLVPAVFAYLWATSSSYLSVLWTTDMGLIILATSILFYLAGIVVILLLIRVKTE